MHMMYTLGVLIGSNFGTKIAKNRSKSNKNAPFSSKIEQNTQKLAKIAQNVDLEVH